MVHYLPDPGSPSPARAGFVVGRSVGNSVVRHRVIRRLRHLVRDRLGVLAPGSRLVVRALPPAATADSATLGRDLDSALAKLGLAPATAGVAGPAAGDGAAAGPGGAATAGGVG